MVVEAAMVAEAENFGFQEWIESEMNPLPKPGSGVGDLSPAPKKENAVDETDKHFMATAIEMAENGRGLVEPNPMVGCVLVRDGEIVGKGWHQRFGGPHAEVEALRSLESIELAKGSTAYVSLEPCCHHGKTPPCAKALVDAGVSRVVVAMADPFPQVSGGGIQYLQAAGVETTVGVLREEAENLNLPYLKLVQTGRPWVIAKWAMTLDGRIATRTGQSQWITDQQARDEVHRLRARVDGIAVGMGTVIADDPMLTARGNHLSQERTRVLERFVFCRHRLPSLGSKLVLSAREAPVTLLAGAAVDAVHLDELRNAGVKVVALESPDAAAMVIEGLDLMGQNRMTNLMLEGGAELLASFFEAEQVDECHVYLGAKLFGGQAAKGPVGGAGIDQITDAVPYRLVSMDALGNDLRAVYRRDICKE